LKNQEGYLLKLTVKLEVIIMEDYYGQLHSQFVNENNLTDFYSKYERINFLSSRNLLKIVLYLHINGDVLKRGFGLRKVFCYKYTASSK